ncbi:MAG: site-specific DNA-methyltransferase, partial [Bacteroidales bacterium]|nr:site-specific DNA-methyltransferase [Bacteroidales bacterium]
MAKHTYTPVVAEAHTPPYKIHKYFARRPHNVFSELISSFTDENDIVVDPFCGGG